MREMLKYLIPAAVLAAVGIPLALTIPSASLMVAGIMAVVTAIILVFIALVGLIGGKVGKRPSGWKLFALGDLILIALAVVLFIVSYGEMLSAVMVYAFPLLGALLVLEWLLWRMSKMLRTDDTAHEEHTHEH